MIVIIDYGAGNLRSIFNKIERLGLNAKISSKKEDILAAEKLILPGVGYFAKGMENLKASGLLPVLEKKVIKEKTPILGICLGMQFFADFSEEGEAKGLGWIKGKVKKFQFSRKTIKIPHMGWNTVNLSKKSLLFDKIPKNSEFYFVHSYHFCPENKENILATTNYGEEFVCAVGKDNIYGVQFHPEKSHKEGIQLIRNFAEKINA